MKSALAAILIVILVIVFVAPTILKVGAITTIYILADGTVSPPTPLIQQDGNLYTFASDINGSIIVQKSGITIDGNNYMLLGNHSSGDLSNGLTIDGVGNVTTKNITIRNYYCGIFLGSNA
jgi:hypothetical protein